MGRLVIRYYKRGEARIGPVLLDAYRRLRVEETSGDMVDVLAELGERYANSEDTLVEVVELDERGEEKLASAYTSASGGTLLFQRPARLRRIVLVDEKAAAVSSPQPLDRLPSYSPREELYVYAGRIVVEKPGVVAALLETDMGSRVVLLPPQGVKKDSNSSKAS